MADGVGAARDDHDISGDAPLPCQGWPSGFDEVATATPHTGVEGGRRQQPSLCVCKWSLLARGPGYGSESHKRMLSEQGCEMPGSEG